jgi:general secretion pathway protein C
MFPRSPDPLQRRRRVRARWLALGLGLSLTVVGAGDGVQGASNDPDARAVNESSPTLATTHEASVLPPASAAGTLTGTILSAVSEARAIIADAGGRQRVYARGEEISDGGKIVEIHRDHIVLRRDGRLEALAFSGSIVTSAIQPAPGANQATSPEDHPWDPRDAMFTQPELLLQMVGATIVVEGGHFRGYRVMQPADPTFLKSIGLEPGDILTEVNGVPLETAQDYGAELFDTLRGKGRVTYTFRRGSEMLVLCY